VGGKGKRGGGRAIYVLIVTATAYLLLAYGKNEQADLSEGQRKAIAALIRELKNG
jgi:hypothetical protein